MAFMLVCKFQTLFSSFNSSGKKHLGYTNGKESSMAKGLRGGSTHLGKLSRSLSHFSCISLSQRIILENITFYLLNICIYFKYLTFTFWLLTDQTMV